MPLNPHHISLTTKTCNPIRRDAPNHNVSTIHIDTGGYIKPLAQPLLARYIPLNVGIMPATQQRFRPNGCFRNLMPVIA